MAKVNSVVDDRGHHHMVSCRQAGRGADSCTLSLGKGQPVGWLVSSEEYKRSSKKSSIFSKDAEAIEGDMTQLLHMQQTSWERDSLS